MEQYFKKEAKSKVRERILTSDKYKFIFDRKTIQYRFIPDEFFSPTPVIIYGKIVAMIVWDPLTIIRIENADLVDSYRKHFELLWKGAKSVKRK